MSYDTDHKMGSIDTARLEPKIERLANLVLGRRDARRAPMYLIFEGTM